MIQFLFPAGGSLAAKRKRGTFLFSNPPPLDARIANHVAKGRTELTGRWHSAIFEASGGFVSPGSLSEASARSMSPRAWTRASRTPSPDARSLSPTVWEGSRSQSRSQSPVTCDEQVLYQGERSVAERGSSGLMRGIVSHRNGTAGEGSASSGSPIRSDVFTKSKAVWMAPGDKQVERAAGQLLSTLIDQKAQKTELEFQAVAASVAAGVEDDLRASIGRQEDYGVLVDATPIGVHFHPVRKLRCQRPMLGLHPSARIATKKQLDACSNPIRVPTLPKRTGETVKYREEAIMDGVVAMVPEAPASGLLIQGLTRACKDDEMDKDDKDVMYEYSQSQASGFAAQMQAAARPKSRQQGPTEAEQNAACARKEKQVRLLSCTCFLQQLHL